MDDLSEKTGLGEGEHLQFKEIIAAVFKNHAVLPCPFGCIDKVPAVFQSGGRRNFNGDMFPVFHSIKGDGNMMEPIGTDVHKVNIRILTESLVRLLLSAIRIGGKALAREILHAGIDPFLFDVTNGRDMTTGNESKPFHSITTSHSEADYAYSDISDRICGKLQHIFLAGGTGGNFRPDNSVGRSVLPAT
jgi:hypothetical protein